MKAQVGASSKDLVTLSEISAFITKGSTPTTYGFKWERSGVLFLRSECVSGRGLDLGQSMFISDATNNALRRSRVEDGDILLTITGNVGRVIHLVGIGEANINQHIARIRIKDPRFDRGYVYHYLAQQSIRRYYESIVTGQAYPQISLAQVRATKIPAPPIGEQRAMAAALNTVDEFIAALEQLISKKRAIRRGMMQQLLAGRIRLHGFRDPWAATTLGALGTFLRGQGIKRDDVRSTGVRCMRYGELYTVFDDYASEARSFVSPTVAATALPLRGGDLLFAASGETRGEIGKCVAYIGPTPAVVGGDVIVLRGVRFNPIFMALLANTPEVVSQKSRAGQGDAVVHIYSRSLAAIEVNLPPRAEQDAIAQVVVDSDREIKVLRERLAKAQTVKKGMMQELLTGRTRLPDEEMAE